MSKITLTGTLSVDTTLTIDSSVIEDGVKDLREASEDALFEELPVKAKVFTKLVLEAFDKDGIEGAAREILRLNIRVGMNEVFAKELATVEDKLTIKVSPAKYVLGTAQKVLNAAKVKAAFAKADSLNAEA